MRFIWALLAAPVLVALLANSGGLKGSAELVGVLNGVEMSPPYWKTTSKALCSGKEIHVATLRADAPAEVQFSVEAKGSARIVGGLAARLAGPKEYVVQMPCAVSTGQCIRAMVLILGYDAPLEIAPGVYDIYIKGFCEVEKGGELNVVIKLRAEAKGSTP